VALRRNFALCLALREPCLLEGRVFTKFKEATMSLLLIIIILLIVFGGGGGYYAHRSYGGRGLGGVLGLILIVLLVLWLVGALSTGVPVR
jgi:hypothetical protein